MKKILISRKTKVNLLVKLFFDKVYLFADETAQLRTINKKNIKYTSPDFISLREDFLQENIASKFADDFLHEYIGEVPNLFPNKESYNFLYWDLKKYLAIEILKYLRIEYLADKILDKEKIENCKIFIEPENLDYKIYKLLKKKNKIKHSIPFLIKLISFFKSLIKSTLSILYIILMPEMKFFSCKGSSKKKNNFKVGYNLFFRQDFARSNSWHGSPDFFLKEDNFDKNEVLYIANSRIQISKNKINEHNLWIDELKEKNYHVIDLNSITGLISKKKYLQSIYPEAKQTRIFFLKNFKILKLININAANILLLNINWKIFFELFYIKHFFSSMVFGENITNYLQSKNSVSTNYIYFSTSGNFLDKRKFKNHTEWIQYSYHKYDNFFGTKLSYNQLKSYENIFKNFCEVGNFSTYNTLKTNKNSILAKLNIPENKKIISFYDTTWHTTGVQSFKSYEEYLDSILKIINDDKKNIYIIKTKKLLDYILNKSNDKIFCRIQELVKSKKIYFFDETLFEKYKVDTHELISVSDICVFAPMSSLIYDALCAKKKCIVFDPDKIYDHEQYIYTRSKLIYAQTYLELLDLLSYWKDDNNSNMVEAINKDIIKPYIDKYCDKESVTRFINYLNID